MAERQETMWQSPKVAHTEQDYKQAEAKVGLLLLWVIRHTTEVQMTVQKVLTCIMVKF